MVLALWLVTLAVGLHFPGAAPIASAGTMLRPPASFTNPSRIAPVAERNYSSVTWFRLSLDRGASQSLWGLRYSYKITRIDIYAAAHGGPALASGGFDLGARDGSMFPGFLALPESTLHGKPFYVRVESVIDPRSISIVPVQSVLPVALQRRTVFGISIGFYLTVGVLFLLMFASSRERALADYSLVMATQALKLIASFGVLWQVLPPLTFLQRELIYDGLAMAGELAICLFTVRFLQLHVRDARARTAVFAGMAVWFGTLAVDFVQNAAVAFWVTFSCNVALYGALLYAGLRARGAVRGAHYYVAAVAAFIAGYAINMSSMFLPWPEVTVFGTQAGTVIGSLLLALAAARQIQEAETLASRDGLTNVLNRRSFDAALASLSTRAMRSGAALGVLLIDIDRFKEYNDRFGHLAGDDCLISVARACAACVRANDVFARFGGEEFGAVITAPTLDDLQAIAQRMMDAVAALNVTVSIGGTILVQRRADDAHDLLKTADQNLYSAKLAGRNRVVLA